jgi:hypothetical protein
MIWLALKASFSRKRKLSELKVWIYWLEQMNTHKVVYLYIRLTALQQSRAPTPSTSRCTRSLAEAKNRRRHEVARRSSRGSCHKWIWVGVGVELQRSEASICWRRLHSDGLSADRRTWSSSRRLESVKGRKWRRQHDLTVQHGWLLQDMFGCCMTLEGGRPCCISRSCCLLHFLPFADSSLLLLLHGLWFALSPSDTAEWSLRKQISTSDLCSSAPTPHPDPFLAASLLRIAAACLLIFFASARLLAHLLVLGVDALLYCSAVNPIYK